MQDSDRKRKRSKDNDLEHEHNYWTFHLYGGVLGGRNDRTF